MSKAAQTRNSSFQQAEFFTCRSFINCIMSKFDGVLIFVSVLSGYRSNVRGSGAQPNAQK